MSKNRYIKGGYGGGYRVGGYMGVLGELFLFRWYQISFSIERLLERLRMGY